MVVRILALLTAVTGGRIGVFRPVVSPTGATDLSSVAATLMLVWIVVFDFPQERTAARACSWDWWRR